MSAAGAGPAITSTTDVVVGAETGEKQVATADGEITSEVDVLVVGGGTAGTITAIQAGRAGAKTLLVERHSQLGGMTTTGAVECWGRDWENETYY